MDAKPAAAAAAQTEDRLLHVLYGTLNDDTQWQQVLAALCRRFATRAAALAHYDFDAGAGRILYQAPADGPLQAIYDQGRPLNPWFLSKAPYLPGRILDSPELIAPEDFLQTDFYREILRPHGLFHRLCGCWRASATMSGIWSCIAARSRCRSTAPTARACAR